MNNRSSRRIRLGLAWLMVTSLIRIGALQAAEALRESFEDIPAGEVPPKWGVAASGGAKVGVVEKTSPSGKKCLRFQNATDAERSFEPDLEIALELKGTVKMAFDVMLEDADSQLTIAPRRDPKEDQPAMNGPLLLIGKQGKVSALCGDAWRPCGKVAPGKWLHCEITIRLAGESNPGWDLRMTRDGQTEVREGLPFQTPAQTPDQLTRLVFHGTNQNASATYLDNLVVETSDGKTPDDSKKKDLTRTGEDGAADGDGNLCRRKGVTVEADSCIRQGKNCEQSLIDGDRSIYWLAGRRKTRITVTFPEPVTVAQSFWFHAAVTAGALDDRAPRDYDIHTSLDGKTWREAVSVRGYLGGQRHDSFSPRQARYVRLQILQTQGSLLPVLCEWELYERPRPIPAAELAWQPGMTRVQETAPPPPVLEVEADKMMYRPGENARLSVGLNNLEDAEREFRVTLEMSQGVATPRKLKEWKVAIPGRQTKWLRYTVKRLRDEYGYGIVATAAEMGKAPVRADGVFEVADEWAKIARMNDDVGGYEKLDPDYPLEEIDQVHAPVWRKLHLNCIQFFGQHVYFSQHDTDRAEWDSPYPDARNNPRSAATTQRWVKASHANGIRFITYTESGALSPQLNVETHHPEWVIHGPLTFPAAMKSLYCLPMYFHDLAGSFPKGKPIVAPDLHYNDAGNLYAMKNYLAEDFAKAVARFGWDGVFADSFGWALEDSAFGSDRNGKPLNRVLPDEVGASLLAAIKGKVREKAGKGFVLVANFGVPQGLTPWHEENPDLEAFRKNRAVYRQLAGEMGIFFLEQHPAPPCVNQKDPEGGFIYPQTLEDTVRALRLIREANDINVPVMLFPLQYIHQLNATVVDAHLLFSCAYANGVLLSMCRGTPPHGPLGEVMETEANYNKFAARYGEYLFDLNNRWLPKGEVACDAPENVWWQGMTSYRKYVDGHMNVYVHLINRPAVPLTWGKAVQAPKPVKDIRVTVKAPRGKRLTGIWAVSPNGSHDPRPLATDEKDGAATVVAPELNYWTMLVCQYEPSKQP